MKLHDISIAISPDMPVYSGDPAVEITPVSLISQGAGANVSMIKIGSHTGTHVDPPYHMLESGTRLDGVPLGVMVGECLVCVIGDVPAILVERLEAAGIPEGTERILFKTRNSGLWAEPGFQTDFTYLDPNAADWLVQRGIKLIGIDYLSIDRFKSGGHPAHDSLLGAGVVIVEGLDLSRVSGGTYTLVCLPLKIEGGDGGPARAILIG